MPDTSLRVTLFQRLGELQMWLFSRFLWYAGIIYLTTLVLFALLRLFTGISVKRIGYFCLRHITINPKQGIEIRIGRLGLFPHRPTVARPGFFTFLVANLEVHVDPEELVRSADFQKKKKQSNEDGSSKSSDQSDSDSDETSKTGEDASDKPKSKGLNLDDLDMFEGVQLLSPDSWKFKMAQWLVSHLQVFNLQFQGTSVVVHGITSVICTSIYMRLDLRKTLNAKLSNFVGTLDSYRLEDGELPISAKLNIVDVYTAQSLEDEEPWQVFGDLHFDISGVLNVAKLRVKEFGVQVHSGRFQIDVDHLIKTIKKISRTRTMRDIADTVLSPPDENEGDEKASPAPEVVKDEASASPEQTSNNNKGFLYSEKLNKTATSVLKLIMRIQFTIGFTEILRIPVSEGKDTAYIAMSMKDLNFDMSRMNPKNSSFRLEFDDGDFAHQAVFTFASFYAGLDEKNHQEEILYVPLVTSLTRTNISSQTLKLLAGDSSRNNSRIITRAMIYSPQLTLEESQFPNIIKAALGLVANCDRRKATTRPSEEFSSSELEEEAFSNYSLLPILDIDVAINNPATRIVCCDTHFCNSALFVASSRRVQLCITSKHDDKSNAYSAKAEYDAFTTSVTFHSKQTENLQLVYSEYSGSQICLTTVPALNVDIDLQQRIFTVNAITHEVFHAIAQLHVGLRDSFNSWIDKHPNFYREFRIKRAKRIEESRHDVRKTIGYLRRIPKWLGKVSFVAENFDLVIATNRFRGKENDILGIKATTANFRVDYNRQGHRDDIQSAKDPIGSSFSTNGEYHRKDEYTEANTDYSLDSSDTDNRELSVCAADFNVYKADHQLLNMDETDSYLMSSHSTVELPKLRLNCYTHNQKYTDIDVRVEPRLKVRLNINLILAFSVLREIVDLVLLKHLKQSSSADAGNATEDLEVDTHRLSERPEIPFSLEHHHVNVALPRALIKIDMPSDDQVMLEFNQARFAVAPGSSPLLHAKAIRLYSQHPFQRSAWCILMSFIGVNALLNHTRDEKEKTANGDIMDAIKDKVSLDVKGMRINVPYKFKLYRIIDNGITLAKAIKTLMLQTYEQDISLVLSPKSIEGVPAIPRVHLKTKQLVVSLEDDYFESDVTLIMLTQLEAASARRHKLYLFDGRIKAMLKGALEYLSPEKHRNGHSPKPSKHFNTFNLANAFQRPKRRNESGERPNVSFTEDDSVSEDDDFDASTPKEPKAPPSSGKTPVHVDSQYVGSDQPKVVEVNEESNDSSNTSDKNYTGSKESKENDGEKQSAKDKNSEEKKKSIEDEYGVKLSEPFLEAIARTLKNVPVSKIHLLMSHGIELGTLCSDGDPVLVNEHPWLAFWTDPDFAEFRRLRVPLQNSALGKLSVAAAREALLEDFSRMWIDRIRNDRMKQHLGVAKKRSQVFHDDIDEDTCREERIIDYSQKPLVMQLDFRDLDLEVEKTHHDTNEKMRKFMHDVGKGQPMDTQYSILIPLYLNVKAYGGLKVEVRDYPLPVLHFPPLARSQDTKNNCALQIKGDLIITEQMVKGYESIRKLFVPLRPLPRDLRHKRGSDVLEVHRTLNPIKTYTTLQFKSESSLPSRVCWCMAYKAGFHSIGEAFSGFSKPSLDPSPMVGFWDKTRLVFHARLDFKLPKSPLALLMKGGRSPYGLQNDDSGFLFLWKDNVRVQINEKDDPTELFKFESEKFELLVPNYVDWEASFLHATPAERAWPRQEIIDKSEPSEKVVFSFNQHTIWKLGMSFERPVDEDNGKLKLRSQEFRPHYDINLSMPEYIKEKDYDCYRGFRSDFIHMAISVISRPFNGDNEESLENATEESGSHANRCTCHLTHKVLSHFNAWKDQFSSQHWPPIRMGSLFDANDGRQALKRTFGTALSTAVYQIALSPIDLSFFHQMRHRNNSENYDHCSGIKAKIDDLVFDWHTRREPPEVKDDEGNDMVELQGNRRWRMHSYLGEVSLQSVHVRAIEARLRSLSSTAALRELQSDGENSDSDSEDESDASSSDANSSYSQSQHHSDKSAGSRMYGPQYIGNNYWIDLEDYVDIGCGRKHRSKNPHVKVYPFMYVPNFVYVRRTDFSGKATYLDTKTGNIMPKFNDMLLHDCLLLSKTKSAIQNELLKGRLGNLQEQMSDINDSLESIQQTDAASMTRDIDNKVKELKDMLSIARISSCILEKEIQHHESGEHYEKQNCHNFVMANRESLESQLGDFSPKPGSTVYEGQQRDWQFGTLESHDDVSSNNMMTFDNVYLMHAPHLRWNNNVRDVVYRLQTSLSEDKELQYVSCRRAVQYFEELVAKYERDEKKKRSNDHNDNGPSEGATSSSEKIDNNIVSGYQTLIHSPENGAKFLNDKAHTLQNQIAKPINQLSNSASNSRNVSPSPALLGDSDDEILSPKAEGFSESGTRLKKIYKDLQSCDSKYHTLRKSHSVSLLSPRILLISEEKPDDCLQMAGFSVEMQVTDIYSKFGTTESENSKVEQRIGGCVSDAAFFVMSRDDLKIPAVALICLEQYSGNEANKSSLWPPWLSIDICYNKKLMEQFMVVQDTSFGAQFYKPNTMHVASLEEEKHRGVSKERMDSEDDEEKLAEAVDKSYSRQSHFTHHHHENQTDPFYDEHGRENFEEHKNLPGIDENMARTLRYHGKHEGKSLLSNVIIDAPHLVLNLDSKQFTTIYAIVTDLLSYTDPLTKRRDKAIDRVFLTNDFKNDFQKTLTDVEVLQKDIRNLNSLFSELLINSLCQNSPSRETRILLIKLEREIFRRQTLLMVHMRAFKAALRRQIETGWDKITKLSLLVDLLTVRILSETSVPLISVHLQRLHFARLSNEGAGSMNRFTLKSIYARNNDPKAIYPHILANYNDNRYAELLKDALRAEWTNLDKVGGIPILECVMARLKPLHVQIEHGVFETLLDFIFPIKNKSQKKINNGEDNSLSSKRSHSSDRSGDDDDSMRSDDDEDDDDIDDFSDDDILNDDSDNASGSGSETKKKSSFLKMLLPRRRQAHNRRNDVDEMVDRASNYMSIRSLRIFPTQIVVSYKGKHKHGLLNLQNLTISLPAFEVENRTWTKLELIMRIRHMAIKTLLSQTGSIIGNKLRTHKSHTYQDDRDLALDQLDESTTEWAEEAARLDDDISKRETGASKPAEFNHKGLLISPDFVQLLRPYHRDVERQKEMNDGKRSSLEGSHLSVVSSRSSLESKNSSVRNNHGKQEHHHFLPHIGRTSSSSSRNVPPNRTVTQNMGSQTGSSQQLRQQLRAPSSSRSSDVSRTSERRSTSGKPNLIEKIKKHL